MFDLACTCLFPHPIKSAKGLYMFCEKCGKCWVPNKSINVKNKSVKKRMNKSLGSFKLKDMKEVVMQRAENGKLSL